MDDFGADAWMERLQAQAAMITVDDDITVWLEQSIDDGAVWHVTIDGGAVHAAAGPDPDADITIAVSAPTAAAIAAGRQSAQRAFLDGDLRIGGDIGSLLAHRETLAQVAALMRAVAT